MFGRKNRKHTVINSLVGQETVITGDLTFEGGCHIDGKVIGNVTADPKSNSALSISDNGSVEGVVNVPFVTLNGIVKGDVSAQERVELGPTARVVGDVYYNLIEMAIGAEINGKLVHQPAGPVALLEKTVKIVAPGDADEPAHTGKE